MLKNCFLPVNYKKPISQACGEIVCENLAEFIINCKLCKIKIFVFEEFVQHFKNIHLDETNKKQMVKPLVNGEQNTENDISIIKIEITETVEHKKPESIKSEDYDSTGENEEFLWDIHIDNSTYSDDDAKTEEEDEGDEEQIQSIMRKTRKPKELSCEICSKKYADSKRLQLHKQTVHLSEKPFKCSTCEESFSEERALKNHTEQLHIGYECPQCHKNLASNRNLKLHMLLHLDKKEFICTEDNCDKAFATKGLLKNHQRYHNIELLVCEECGYKCRARESLIVHKRHHTGEKPFDCKICDRRFGSRSVLREHMVSHDTERKHVCDVCGKNFVRPRALYHHKHLHLGIKKFLCKICGQAFAQAAGLSTHMRKHRDDIAFQLC